MIYVGINIAKPNHFSSAISSDVEILVQSFKFTNDGDCIQLLVPCLKTRTLNLYGFYIYNHIIFFTIFQVHSLLGLCQVIISNYFLFFKMIYSI